MKKKLRLFPITAEAAARNHPGAFQRGMAELEDVDAGDLDWYVDRDGFLWTNDALESHGWTFFNLSLPRSKPVDVKNVEVL